MEVEHIPMKCQPVVPIAQLAMLALQPTLHPLYAHQVGIVLRVQLHALFAQQVKNAQAQLQLLIVAAATIQWQDGQLV